MYALKRSGVRASLMLCVALTAAAVLAQNPSRSQEHGGLNAARYTPEGGLQFPEGTQRWVTLGANLGGDYSEGAFDPGRPGVIGVVQMEPNAYRTLRETGRYPDGTLLLLTVYRAESKSEPQLRGFVQGETRAREIHVIDRRRFPEEGRAFFVFPGATSRVGTRVPLGSGCVKCHTEHARLDGTFAQFYPLVRPLAEAAKPRN